MAPSPSGAAKSSIETDGGGTSSFSIVPWPRESAIVAPNGSERSTKNTSSGSRAVSPLTSTLTAFSVSPFAKLSVPLVAVYEGHSGTTPFVFTVKLAYPPQIKAAGPQVAVRYAMADGRATAPEDYLQSSGRLVFGPGETEKKITDADAQAAHPAVGQPKRVQPSRDRDRKRD